MSVAEQVSSIAERRNAAVAEVIAKVRRLEAEHGVTPKGLAAIKQAMLALAARRDLFPPEHFPLDADGSNVVYRLSEDADHRFTLYMSTGQTGKETPPHDHTTWACIAGVKGKEHQRFYRRTDDGRVPYRGRVEVADRFTVEPGTACTLLPDTIHSIHLEGEAPTLNLHLYGMAIDHLPGRVAYNMEDGTYAHFPPATIR
jgi:predicted metal-dependent enzyme (double-stranded beta helix superfamily)